MRIHMHARAALVTMALATTSCVNRVELLSSAGAPVTATPAADVPLEVVTHGAGVPDPLPVRRSLVAFTDVEAALGLAVTSAAVPWAEAHRALRPGGWQLLVELTRAEAEETRAGRLVVTLDVRATLRSRATRFYIAQTQAHCRQAGLVDAAKGGQVVYACMSGIGRDLTSWLGAVQP
jgi:hypothetical protein